MVTFQDFLAVGERDTDKMTFIRSAINQHQTSELYKVAVMADEYDRKRNRGIRNFTKMLYTISGRQIPDTYSANYKVGRAFFPFFVIQEVQYLLSNGVTFEDETTKDKLEIKGYKLDTQLQSAAHKALVGGCSFGFWNLDHVEVFGITEFVPLYDENNSALRAGIRYWQMDAGKPFRATLYEENGYTEYVLDKKDENGNVKVDGEVLQEKRSYIIKATGAPVDENKNFEYENYPSFPIVPFWGNKNHQSEIIGLVEQIDVYDLIKSGFCNSVEEASYVYWAITNASGMDDIDLAEFKKKVSTLHIAKTEQEGSTATPSQIETPYQSREALLDRMEKDLFKDAMAFDPENIASGAITATQIRAAYENLDMKCNDFEYCTLEFLYGIMDLAGIEDNPTFTRSKNVNVSEEVQTIVMAAEYLGVEYCTKKILSLLGDGDQAEEIINQMIADEQTRQAEIPEDEIGAGVDENGNAA